MGVIVYPTIHTVDFEDYSSHDIPTALASILQIASEGQNLKFIDFSYTHTVGEPIQFIIEKTRDTNCNSYDAKITDDEGNFVLGWGAEISCDPNFVSNLVQTKIGYNESKPIIINESGRYYLEVEFVDAVIKREFVVRQNHGGGSLDRTVYPIPFDMPSPYKQMKLGIKLGHIICDKDKFPVWNIHYKPACVYSDTESELIKRGWAKLRLMLPASADPIKELEITGQNEFSYRVMGNLVYGDDEYPLSHDRKKEIALEYSQKYHPEENYLEYAVTSHEKHHDVGDKIQFDLLEWGNYSDCSNLKLRIIDVQDQVMFEHISKNLCVTTGDSFVIFNLYSMGDDFEEFVCDKTGYYRIQVSNGDIFPPTILQNFACLEPESIQELDNEK